MNTEKGIITGVKAISGGAWNGHYFCLLVDQNLKKNSAINIYTVRE